MQYEVRTFSIVSYQYSVLHAFRVSHSKFEFLRRFSTNDVMSLIKTLWANFCQLIIHQATPRADNDEMMPRAGACYTHDVDFWPILKHQLSPHTC